MLLLLVVFIGLGYSTVDLLVAPTTVSFVNDEAFPVTLTGVIFVPPGTVPASPVAAIVFAHGDTGLFWSNGSSLVVKENYKKWANIAVCANTIALFVDSFKSRNSLNVDPVTERTFDLYAAFRFLTTDVTYSALVDSSRIYTVGWASGGTAVMAAMSDSDTHYVNQGLAFAGSSAFYPSCRMQNAFGTVFSSTYCPYAPYATQLGSYDFYETFGACLDRKSNSPASCNATIWKQNIYWLDRPGAKFGFDDSTTLPLAWTQEDIQASQQADPAILSYFGLSCSNSSLWLTPDSSQTLPPTVPPAGTIARDPTPTGGAPCTNDTDCGGISQGACIEGECVCNYMFANVSCNYARKNRAYAGGLQVGLAFIGVGGVGQFYLQNNPPAVGQLILLASSYLMCCFCCILGPLCCLGKKGKYAFYAITSILSIVVVFAGMTGFLWTIIDGALILENKITDSNGYMTYWPN